MALKLSTARPSLGGTLPNLKPWYLKVYEPSNLRMKGIGRAMPAMAMDSVESEQSLSMAPRGASVSKRRTSVLFEVDGTSSVASDGTEHRVAISSFNWDAKLSYKTVPMLDKHAYLTATSKNESPYPLLAGKAQIFLDGSFVTTAPFEMVAPNQPISLSLGVDENVSVERKLVKNVESKEGFGGRLKRHTYLYSIVAKNKHEFPVSLEVIDRVPFSMDEQITVKLKNPTIGKESKSVWLDEDHLIHWKKILKPNEEWKIPLEFWVEASKGVSISGLK